MIDVNILNVKANKLQLLSLIIILEIFSKSSIKNEKIDYSEITGIRGIYTNKKMLQILLSFNINEFYIKFYLYHNQLEYYIFNKNENQIAECNLEDFDTFDKMVLKYQEYLLKDLKKHSILINGNVI